MDWKKVKKRDAHIHLLPNNELKRKDTIWNKADKDIYLDIMKKYNIDKAITVPSNDQFMYFKDASVTDKYHYELNLKNGEFIPFIDIVNTGGYFYLDMPCVIEEAVKKYNLKVLKIYPSNLGINIDLLDMVPIFRKGCDLNLVIMIHSCPYYKNNYDCCKVSRIHNISKIFPNAKIIISHMGGHSYHEVLGGNQYVYITTFLLELVELQGIESTNKILRSIGVERLTFATDYPQVYKVNPSDIYDKYCDILNQMDFNEEEIQLIAYKNISTLLNI